MIAFVVSSRGRSFHFWKLLMQIRELPGLPHASNVTFLFSSFSYDDVRGPFSKFVDSPYYYSESELCGGAVTVFFRSTYLASEAILTTLHPLLENVLQTVITSKFLVSELPFHGSKGPEIAWGEIWIEFCVRLGKSGSMEPPLEHPFSRMGGAL
jgi:hypothetical protein